MTLVQILFIVLAVIFLFKTIVNFKNNKVRQKTFLFWTVLWIAVIVLAVIPQTTNFFSKILGIGRGVDVAVYFSIILLFFLVYKIGIRLEKIEHEITELVRRETLKK